MKYEFKIQISTCLLLYHFRCKRVNFRRFMCTYVIIYWLSAANKVINNIITAQIKCDNIFILSNTFTSYFTYFLASRITFGNSEKQHFKDARINIKACLKINNFLRLRGLVWKIRFFCCLRKKSITQGFNKHDKHNQTAFYFNKTFKIYCC